MQGNKQGKKITLLQMAPDRYNTLVCDRYNTLVCDENNTNKQDKGKRGRVAYGWKKKRL